MTHCHHKAICLFVLVSIVFSMFFGTQGPKLFVEESLRKNWNSAKKFYQFWFNFIGSFTGWMAVLLLLINIRRSLLEHDSLGFGNIFLFFVGFIGITGHLPLTMAGLIEGVQELAKKVTGIK
jgi:hypothetical protein